MKLGPNNAYLPWFQLAFGMAEDRSGNYSAAEQALDASEQTAKNNPLVQRNFIEGTAQFFKAMSLFNQGKKGEAREFFTKAMGQMKALPTDARQPFANGSTPDDIVVWLAYKEASALLNSDPQAAPPKPSGG